MASSSIGRYGSFGSWLHRTVSGVARAGGLAAALASTSIVGAPEARACGGFFCNGPTDPVVQTKEGIIFGVDHEANEVTAIINIAYQGTPSAFAWILPLQVEPTDIDVGAASAFAVADAITAPRFQITAYETDGVCDNGDVLARSSDFDASVAPPPGAEGDKGVEVLSQEQVGPYESVVLRGSDPDAVEAWLLENGYQVTDDMMMTVVPYLSKGDVLLALKLQKNADSGAVQPIAVKMPGTTEACIPLRMTAIAAQEDMDVVALVLSDEGRAIPQNYNHVTLNLAKIDWLNGGANYRQLVGQAADEGDGNAFTTEFAGPASVFAGRIFVEGQYNLDVLRQETRLRGFLTQVQSQGWQRRPELRAILLRHLPELASCGSCDVETVPDRDLDPGPIVDEIEERVVGPERAAQALFDKHEYLTRLYTLISPEEMNVDPIFGYSRTLEDVSNVHGAKLVMHCGLGGSPGSAGVEVILDDGTQLSFESSSDPDRSVIDQMPAAVKVEQLATQSLLNDNSARIADLVSEQNSRVGGCGCAETGRGGQAAGGLSLFALALLGVLRRRR